jgi:hypothetical protein
MRQLLLTGVFVMCVLVLSNRQEAWAQGASETVKCEFWFIQPKAGDMTAKLVPYGTWTVDKTKWIAKRIDWEFVEKDKNGKWVKVGGQTYEVAPVPDPNDAGKGT